MKSLMILALATTLGIPGNIHGEYMLVVKNNKKVGCVLQSEDGNIWATEHKVKGVKKNQVVTVYMSDNDTPNNKYDDIIVKVERR